MAVLATVLVCQAPHQFEWVRGLESFLWREAEVSARQRAILVRSFAEVLAKSQELDVTMRIGAYVLAVAKVAQAREVRGIYP